MNFKKIGDTSFNEVPLSEADQSLLKKEDVEFLQCEKILFELLYNFNYINKFYLEVHHEFHVKVPLYGNFYFAENNNSDVFLLF